MNHQESSEPLASQALQESLALQKSQGTISEWTIATRSSLLHLRVQLATSLQFGKVAEDIKKG